MPWEKWQKPGANADRYYETATAEELADHVRNMLQWIRGHRHVTEANLAIIYAWNENDEGGWLVPTLGEGTSRLDAVERVLRPGNAAGLR